MTWGLPHTRYISFFSCSQEQQADIIFITVESQQASVHSGIKHLTIRVTLTYSHQQRTVNRATYWEQCIEQSWRLTWGLMPHLYKILKHLVPYAEGKPESMLEVISVRIHRQGHLPLSESEPTVGVCTNCFICSGRELHELNCPEMVNIVVSMFYSLINWIAAKKFSFPVVVCIRFWFHWSELHWIDHFVSALLECSVQYCLIFYFEIWSD